MSYNYRAPCDIVVIDLEANGLDVPDVRIIEIGAVRLNRELKIIDEFEQLVNGLPISERITQLTTITPDMLKDAPTFYDASRMFENWCNKLHDCKEFIIGAYGCYYDIPVLRSEYKRIGRQFPFMGQSLDIKALAWFDSWRISGSEEPRINGGLGRMCKRYGVKFEGTQHRALADARAEAMVLQAIASK